MGSANSVDSSRLESETVLRSQEVIARPASIAAPINILLIVFIFQSFTDEDREVDCLRSQKVCDKLVKTCQILGYELIEINGSIKGKGFSPQIVFYDRDSRLIKFTKWFNLKKFIDNNSSTLESRERVGKRLIKRKNNAVNRETVL